MTCSGCGGDLVGCGSATARIAAPPVVSVQRVAAGDAVARHLAWGALVDADVVVAPTPAAWLLDPEVTFEVLLASSRRTGPGVTERLPVRQAALAGLQGSPDGAIAVLRLAHPSAHRPFTGAGDVDDLARRLAEAEDVWAALEEAGAVPRGVRNLPVEAVLGPVAAWEREHRARLVRNALVETPGQLAYSLCCWLLPVCCRGLESPGPWW